MSVVLIDTSVFCELLAVPGKAGDPDQYRDEMKALVEDGDILLLPMTAIIETGNHIGQCSPNGNTRRHYASLFVQTVTAAIDGTAPFSPTPFFLPGDLREWLDRFPDWAKVTDLHGRGSGFGDLTILTEWERQCELNPSRRVYIWSQDERLTPYDRAPTL